MPQRDKGSVYRLTRLSLLTALSLIMFVIEMQLPPLPLPVPGLKLGLANIVTVYAVYEYKPAEAALVFFARVLLSVLFTGNGVALIFGIAGGTLCLIGMLALVRITDERMLPLASAAGAVLHNVGQIIAAIVVMRTAAVIVYLPFLTLAGCIAGAFTGMCAMLLIKRLGRGRG